MTCFPYLCCKIDKNQKVANLHLLANLHHLQLLTNKSYTSHFRWIDVPVGFILEVSVIVEIKICANFIKTGSRSSEKLFCGNTVYICMLLGKADSLASQKIVFEKDKMLN